MTIDPKKLDDVTLMADRLDRLQSPEHYITPKELRTLLVSFMDLSAAHKELLAAGRVRPFSEYHEDFHDCVWHELNDDGHPFQSPSYVGTPNCSDWPFGPYEVRLGFQVIPHSQAGDG